MALLQTITDETQNIEINKLVIGTAKLLPVETE